MYILDYYFKNGHFHDLNPLSAGEHICPSGHSVGPDIRKYTLIHYVLSGKGTFHARGGHYTVEAGQAFIILPGEVTTYTADAQDPWHYQWIGFDGSLAPYFAQLPPVFSIRDSIFRRAFGNINAKKISEFHFTSVLFQLYDSLFVAESSSNQYVSNVENFIQSNYMRAVRVNDIAVRLNLDRRYLSRLFKENTGQSIQEYLTQVRLDEAANYLQKGYSVAETAAFCGYENVTNFSRMFKKYHGVSPVKTKQQSKNN